MDDGPFKYSRGLGERGERAAFVIPANMLLLFLFFLTALSTTAAEKKLRVVTTIFPHYCFASSVVGSGGEVQNLLPPNVGPHDYQLSPSDLRKLKDADLVILNGAGLDDWIKKALPPSARVLDLSSALKTNLISAATDLHMDGPHKHGHDHQHGPSNPHYWLDPQLSVQCVSNILAIAQKADPSHAANYSTNADAYIARLKNLDIEIAAKVAPVRVEPFITQHDAFPYFVRRYQLNQVGILESTPDVPPSPRYLGDLLKVVREKNVPVIFTDPRSSPRLAKQIAKDAKIRTADLDTLESGPLDAQGYEKGMRRNAEALARELK